MSVVDVNVCVTKSCKLNYQAIICYKQAASFSNPATHSSLEEHTGKHFYHSLRQFLCVLCFMCGPFNNWCFYGNGKLYVSGVNLRSGLTGLIIDLANWHSYFVLRVFWFTTLNIKTIKCKLLWINSKFRFILDSRDFIYYSMLLTLLSFR